MEGKVWLTNHKASAITFEVVLRTGGRAEEATPAAEIVHSPFRAEDWRHYRGSANVNNHSKVRWRVEVEGGASRTLEVGSHLFLEHD